jgi:hypothetical protein
MNHPLPKNSTSSALEYAFELQPASSEMDQDSGSAESTELISAVTISGEANDPYEEYRQRMMRSQPEVPEPPRPAMHMQPVRPDFRSSFARYERYRSSPYDMPEVTMPQIDEMISIDLRERPSFSRNVLLAGLAAIIAGAGLGYVMANMSGFSASTGRAMAFMGSILPTENPGADAAVGNPARKPLAATTISKKPIATASLDVADVQGNINTVIPLMLRADPAEDGKELAIKITGLPQSAFLSAGTRLSDNAWLLKSGEEKGVSLIVPIADAPKFDLAVAAIEAKSGELAAPIREMSVALKDIQPATAATDIMPDQKPLEQVAVQTAPAAANVQITPAGAPPEAPAATLIPQPNAATPAKPAISAEATGLLEKGDTLFQSGDLVMARQFYERAFDMGAPAGAYGVARTYDPTVFRQMNVRGLEPDPSAALQWYQKAKAAGIEEAEAAMAPLQTAAVN